MRKDLSRVILNQVLEELNLTMQDMDSRSRKTNITNARKIYCILAREYTRLTLTEIGKSMGISNSYKHPQVRYNIIEGKKFIDVDPVFRDQINSIRAKIKPKHSFTSLSYRTSADFKNT